MDRVARQVCGPHMFNARECGLCENGFANIRHPCANEWDSMFASTGGANQRFVPPHSDVGEQCLQDLGYFVIFFGSLIWYFNVNYRYFFYWDHN